VKPLCCHKKRFVEPLLVFALTGTLHQVQKDTWDGHTKQAIDHLCEAGQAATDLGLPAELLWAVSVQFCGS
jgi:hypothetical protein